MNMIARASEMVCQDVWALWLKEEMELDLWHSPGGPWKNFACKSHVEYREGKAIENKHRPLPITLKNGKNKDFRI